MAFNDLFGPYSGRRFYLRDFRNAYKFRPDVNPPRQQFQGYVNFILNRDLFEFLYSETGDANLTEFRTTISSLVRTAELPSVNFKTDVKNQYNRKRIVNSGVEYQPVNMTVFDTIGNEWLTVLMRYFSYHYMNPRNKQDGTSRDLYPQSDVDYVTGEGGRETRGSSFGGTSSIENGDGQLFDSNRAGYNPNVTANFFERIDYVLYHGNKGVQYSIHNPALTMFKPGTIDYSSSEVMEFQMTFEYESFTTYNAYNFDLTGEDLDRFEAVSIDEDNPLFANNETDSQISLQERENTFLERGRSFQRVAGNNQIITDGVPGSITDEQQAGLPGVDTNTYGVFTGAPSNGTGASDPFSDVLRGVVDSGIGAAIHGSDIKDAVLGSAVRRTSRIIGDSVNDVFTNGGFNPNTGQQGDQ